MSGIWTLILGQIYWVRFIGLDFDHNIELVTLSLSLLLVLLLLLHVVLLLLLPLLLYLLLLLLLMMLLISPVICSIPLLDLYQLISKSLMVCISDTPPKILVSAERITSVWLRQTTMVVTSLSESRNVSLQLDKLVLFSWKPNIYSK